MQKKQSKKIQSIFFPDDKQFTLLGKFLILGKLYFKGINLIDCILPICKSFILAIIDVSIFDVDMCDLSNNNLLICQSIYFSSI